jgi:iron complex transport system permease protein
MTWSPRRVLIVWVGALVALAVAVLCGLGVGPTSIAPAAILGSLLAHLGIGHTTLSAFDQTVVWQLRGPRMVLGLLAGAMLSVAGGTYQGVFRNPLADPYLLGVAAGAGLGATLAIVQDGNAINAPTWTPLIAFVGATVAVALTWFIGGRGQRASSATLVLAGVAVASLFTSAQTFLQQQASAQSIARVYIWLLGSLAGASWSSVTLVLPYVAVCICACVVAGRALDVLSLGDDEARSVGLSVRRVRAIVIAASSLGTAAIVSVVGLIGFVGIIVPHVVRLLVGTSYRRILPLSVVVGAAFLVLADTVARTALAPSELPLGVVTAAIGAPVFVLILSVRRGMVS